MYSDQIMSWHRRSVIEANAERIEAGVCISNLHQRTPAVYLWHTRPGPSGVGNVLPLCARCCANWREGVVADPSLQPAQISSIE